MTKEQRDQWIEDGLCANCGKNEPERHKVTCTKCLKRNANECRVYYQRNKKKRTAYFGARKAHNKKNRLCVDCSIKLDNDMESGIRCINCLAVVINNRKLNGRRR